MDIIKSEDVDLSALDQLSTKNLDFGSEEIEKIFVRLEMKIIKGSI